MTNQDMQDKAIEAIVIMNTAITNLRLYPPTNAMISQTIDRLLQSLSAMLAEQSPLIIAESERVLIVAGEPASARNQEKPQVRSMIDLMTGMGIRSISFENELGREDLVSFLQTLCLKPQEVKAEGGLQELLFRREILHIKVDEKVYIAKDKDQQLVAGIDVKDDDLVKLLMETDPETTDLEQVKEKARDPEWLTAIFQAGMKHIETQRGSMPDIQLSDNLVRLVGMLEKIAAPEDLDRIVQLVTRSVMELDSGLISLFLSHDVQGLFNGRLFEGISETLGGENFAAVVDGLAEMLSDSQRGQTAKTSLDALMDTGQGRQLQAEREARAAREAQERALRIAALQEKARSFVEQGIPSLIGGGLAVEIPPLVQELQLLGEDRTAEALVEPLIAALHHLNPDVRSRSAATLSSILEDHLADGRMEGTARLTERLTGWLRSETVFSPACQTVCLQLRELARTALAGNPLAETNPVLDVLSLIQSGRSPKEPPMAALASDALRELATPELLATLFGELKTNARGKQKQAAHVLGRLGTTPVEQLLDILRDSEDSDERVRMLQIVSEIGAPAIPLVVARLEVGSPWYVLRNLIYILGRIGGESQAIDLAPLLLHEHPKVQAEALKTLQRIGGKVRAETLLSVLPKADAAFKMTLVEMLGTIKAAAAVSALTALLNAKAILSTKPDLDEKICNALGSIGSAEALPALKEIAGSKGFFTVRLTKDKVKLAAEKAIAEIARKNP
jgi:HEAT repeat protein